MAEKFTRYDTAEYLKTDSDMAAYLDACLEEAGDDPAFIAHALGVIARARGMSQLARDTGLARENLYKVRIPRHPASDSTRRRPRIPRDSGRLFQ